MKKANFVFFVILLFVQSIAFSQWKEFPEKKLSYGGTVFVMPGNNIYHKENCKLLTGGRTGMPFVNAESRGYKPCRVCFPEAFPTGYEWNFSLQGPVRSKALLYSDSYIDVFFEIAETQIGFAIQNKTDAGIKINWDEISFVSPGGRASRVIHSGIRLIDRNNPQAPTMIPPKSRIDDMVIPSDNIYYDNAWHEGRLFAGNELFYNGLGFSLYFPLEIRGGKKEYSFKFKIGVSKITS